MLNLHVGLRLLTDALTCWLCVESTCWLTFTNPYIDGLVDVLSRHVGFRTVLLNAIVVDQLLHLVIKRNKKKNLYITYSKLVENLHSAVAVRCKTQKHSCKTQHHLNRGMMQYIPVEQAL